MKSLQVRELSRKINMLNNQLVNQINNVKFNMEFVDQVDDDKIFIMYNFTIVFDDNRREKYWQMDDLDEIKEIYKENGLNPERLSYSMTNQQLQSLSIIIMDYVNDETIKERLLEDCEINESIYVEYYINSSLLEFKKFDKL